MCLSNCGLPKMLMLPVVWPVSRSNCSVLAFFGSVKALSATRRLPRKLSIWDPFGHFQPEPCTLSWRLAGHYFWTNVCNPRAVYLGSMSAVFCRHWYLHILAFTSIVVAKTYSSTSSSSERADSNEWQPSLCFYFIRKPSCIRWKYICSTCT